MWLLRVICPIGAAMLLGCGAGAYGHSRNYVPLDDERQAIAASTEFDPVMAERRPEEWQNKSSMLFGVVIRRADNADGTVDVALSVRPLAGRNLCKSREEDSCRTTVSDKEHFKIHAVLPVSNPDDREGELAIGAGSLVRVVGVLRPEVSPTDELRVIDATYYRHWPRGYFVTSASASLMKR